MQDNLFEQMANISKAHAYDIVSKQRDELLEENKRLKESVKYLQDLITEYTFEIIGDDRLHIDTKVNGNYETVGIIELVEVYDLEETGTILLETDTFTTLNNIL